MEFERLPAKVHTSGTPVKLELRRRDHASMFPQKEARNAVRNVRRVVTGKERSRRVAEPPGFPSGHQIIEIVLCNSDAPDGYLLPPLKREPVNLDARRVWPVIITHMRIPPASSKRQEPVKAGASRINAGDLRTLQQAWRMKRLVLFLGAGISADYGIPTWKSLVVELLFEQTRRSRQMRDLWPHYGRALCGWLSDYFQYDPVILARAIKTDLREKARKRDNRSRTSCDEKAAEKAFLEKVREKLYARPQPPTPTRTTLDAIADLAQKSTQKNNLAGIINFNFDDLLEQALTARGTAHASVASANAVRTEGLTILHPHGYLPRSGDLTGASIVFTEDEYHQLIESSFHWALTEMVHHLRHCTVLFVGLSMSDPNLRRLIDVARAPKEMPHHFQLQRRHHIRSEEAERVRGDVQRQAARFGVEMRAEEVKSPEQMVAALNATLKQADTYDRMLLESMKVKTIWIEDFPDIPEMLDLIAN